MKAFKRGGSNANTEDIATLFTPDIAKSTVASERISKKGKGDSHSSQVSNPAAGKTGAEITQGAGNLEMPKKKERGAKQNEVRSPPPRVSPN